MAADGSAPRFAPLNTSPTTLADVLRHLVTDGELERRRQRELCSAIHTVCRALGRSPDAVPAQPRELRVLLAAVTAAAAGVGAGRWNNVRSLTLKALKRAGIRSLPGRRGEPHGPEWEVLRALLPDRRFQSGLSRFMSYCTAGGIAPMAVTAETFARFGAELEAHSLARDPGGIHRDSCKLWNIAATAISGWPPLQVEVPVRRQDFSLPLGAFPMSFGADVERYLATSGDPDVFSEGYCKPARPLTLRGRRQNILMAATALVQSGLAITEITALSVLVEPEHARAALRFLYDRAGKKTTGHLYHIASCLKTIARHHVGMSEEALAPLRKLCRGLKPQSTGLTEKNRRFLRQFADVEKLVSLLTVSRRVLAAAGDRNGTRRDAVKVELALAVAIELVIPLRVDNLAGLRLDRHLQWIADRAYLSIPPDETKNENAIEAELPSYLARQLRAYVETYRPRLLGAPSPWLFPGENGERRGSGGFGTQLSAFIAKEAGVMMTVHQFRHLAAKLYLDRHPDGHETVRRLLGHKSLATTMKFYRELESLLATQRYGAFVEQLLSESATRMPQESRQSRTLKRREHGHG